MQDWLLPPIRALRLKNRNRIRTFTNEVHGRFDSFFPITINCKLDSLLYHLLSLFERGFYPFPFDKIETTDAGKQAVIFSLDFERTIDQSIFSDFFQNLPPDFGLPLIFGKFPIGS